MRSPERPGSATPEVSSPEQTAHRSLAFPLLLERLRKSRPAAVLDLGPALGENVSFLSSLPSKLIIADLPQALAASWNGESFAALLERDFPALDEPVDGILAWDLLNYLDAQQVETLGRRLALCCRPDALLYALVSTVDPLPDRPRRFRIAGDETLVYEPLTGHQRPAPRYTEADLRRWLPDFDVDVTFLLRNRMQEYLFARRAVPPTSPVGV